MPTIKINHDHLLLSHLANTSNFSKKSLVDGQFISQSEIYELRQKRNVS